MSTPAETKHTKDNNISDIPNKDLENKPEQQSSKTEPHSSNDDSQTDHKTQEKVKKANPFLSTAVKEESADDSETIKKAQHEKIDEKAKDAIFKHGGKLYFLSSRTKKLETRGPGVFIIVKDDSGLYRLIMIRDGIMLKGCDHYISPKCSLKKATQAKNSWIWVAIKDKSDAEVNEDSTVYFAQFSDHKTAELFESKYNFAKDENEKALKDDNLVNNEKSLKDDKTE